MAAVAAVRLMGPTVLRVRSRSAAACVVVVVVLASLVSLGLGLRGAYSFLGPLSFEPLRRPLPFILFVLSAEPLTRPLHNKPKKMKPPRRFGNP